MKVISRTVVAMLLALVAACATSSHIITGKVRAPIPSDQVAVYTSAPLGSEEIAILSVESSGWTTQGEKDMAVAKLKKEAASLGANGVLITGMGTESSGVVGNVNPQTGAVALAQSNYTAIRAIAIYVSGSK
jgi:uncharacterized protein YbjQ (UPF0145 family)